jgi:hypothetical protein
MIKSTTLAVVLCLCFLGVAAAQSSDSSVGIGQGEPGESAPGTASDPIVFGWNFRHVSSCAAFAGGFLLFASDGTTWSTSDLFAIATLTPACQTGNLVAFHVINGIGTWDGVYVLRLSDAVIALHGAPARAGSTAVTRWQPVFFGVTFSKLSSCI